MSEKQPETLCILCQRSCVNMCSWARDLTPVEGWTDEENRQGWRVIACPEYVKETPETILPQRIDNDGLINLMEAFMDRLRDDYIHGIGLYTDEHEQWKGKTREEIQAMNRQHIEKFLRSKKGMQLTSLSNPDEVIRQLRKYAQQYEQDLMKLLR